MGKCLIFVNQIKQSETGDVTEFWKRVEQEQERKKEGVEAEFMTSGSSNLLCGARECEESDPLTTQCGLYTLMHHF